MATNFPSSVDNFTNPTANDSLNTPSHSLQHANANDAIEAIEGFLLNTYQPSFRNVIINGDFRINQRGFTSTTTSGTYGFDRWRGLWIGGTNTYSTQAFNTGNAIAGYEPINFARIVTSGQSAVGDFTYFGQAIEDVRTFAGQTITLSFWAKANTGTPKIAIEFDQQFGTGGSTRVTNYGGQITLSTSWTRYSITTTLASISGKTVGTSSSVALNMWLSAGSDFNSRTGSIGIQSNTFDIWGVQVEASPSATPFEQRPLSVELNMCYRYYQPFPYHEVQEVAGILGYNSGTNTYYLYGASSLPVPMRTAPSVTLTSAQFRRYDSTVQNVSNTVYFQTSGNGVIWCFNCVNYGYNASSMFLTVSAASAEL